MLYGKRKKKFQGNINSNYVVWGKNHADIQVFLIISCLISSFETLEDLRKFEYEPATAASTRAPLFSSSRKGLTGSQGAFSAQSAMTPVQDISSSIPFSSSSFRLNSSTSSANPHANKSLAQLDREIEELQRSLTRMSAPRRALNE